MLAKDKDFNKSFKKKFPHYTWNEVKNKGKYYMVVEAVGGLDLKDLIDSIFQSLKDTKKFKK